MGVGLIELVRAFLVWVRCFRGFLSFFSCGAKWVQGG